jgi:hypothetical protein
MASLIVSVMVFGTGLVLLFEFHVGGGALRTDFFGLGKELWLDVHRVAALGFLAYFIVHVQRHWKYLKAVAKKWRVNLPKKTKSTTWEQVLLLLATFVVLWAGFYAWMAFPGATLANGEYHDWIDVHNKAGLLLLAGMVVHVKRRWRQIFGAARRDALCGERQLAGEENS